MPGMPSLARFRNRVQATVTHMEECRAFLEQPISDAEAKEMVQRQLASREEAFLGFVENAIYGFPASPYLKLLRHAGFELADVQRMVRESGIEDTLESLHDAGVYVTQDEFKGRAPVRRDRSVAAAGALVAAESVVFLANRGTCPLTPLAEHYGARRGGVSDIFLPDGVARTIPIWATSGVVVAMALHLRRRPPSTGA